MINPFETFNGKYKKNIINKLLILAEIILDIMNLVFVEVYIYRYTKEFNNIISYLIVIRIVSNVYNLHRCPADY